MLDIAEEFKHAYNRDLEKLPEPLHFYQETFINSGDVLKAHYLIAEHFHLQGEKVVFGVKDYNLLGSTLGRQWTGFNGKIKWLRWDEISATLFYGIIKNHPFHDANKRTALLCLIYQLQKFGKTLECRKTDLDKIAVNVASDLLEQEYYEYRKYLKKEDQEIHFLSHWLRRNTREIDKKYYPITYSQFNGLLNKWQISLENPYRNHIDVLQVKEEKLLGIKVRDKKVKIHQIGFPSWKAIVGAKAVKEVLKAAGLTADNGFDSQVFYKDAEPLEALIEEYKEPLKRLKNK